MTIAARQLEQRCRRHRPDVVDAASTQPACRACRTRNTFLNLLVAQLKYQDPLNPTSGTQFLSQTAQLTEVETMNQLQQEVGLENVTHAASGLHVDDRPDVSATLSDGTTVSGVVQGVSLDTSGGPTLNVNGTSVPLSDVQTVGTAPTGSGSS